MFNGRAYETRCPRSFVIPNWESTSSPNSDTRKKKSKHSWGVGDPENLCLPLKVPYSLWNITNDNNNVGSQHAQSIRFHSNQGLLQHGCRRSGQHGTEWHQGGLDGRTWSDRWPCRRGEWRFPAGKHKRCGSLLEELWLQGEFLLEFCPHDGEKTAEHAAARLNISDAI